MKAVVRAMLLLGLMGSGAAVAGELECTCWYGVYKGPYDFTSPDGWHYYTTKLAAWDYDEIENECKSRASRAVFKKVFKVYDCHAK